MKINADVRDTAADWLQRLPDKRMSEDEMNEWLHWYGADADHRRAFHSVQSFDTRLRGMDDRQRALLRAAVPLEHGVSYRRRAVLAMAACFTAAFIGVGVWWTADGGRQTTNYEVPENLHRTVSLPDDSVMVLSAGAVANVRYAREARRLEIVKGAAYFEVERDARRPFTVRAGDVSVTAVGTAFSMAREVNQLSVTVTEGSVDVARGPNQRQRLRAGERVTLAVEAMLEPARALDSNAVNDWQGESARFLNTPLGQVVAMVNEYASTPVRIEDPRLMSLNYSGTVFRGRVDEWIAALPQVYPVRNVPLSDGTVAVVSAEARAPGPN